MIPKAVPKTYSDCTGWDRTMKGRLTRFPFIYESVVKPHWTLPDKELADSVSANSQPGASLQPLLAPAPETKNFNLS